MSEETTSFQTVYDMFLSGITDDMFMELTKEDTEEILQEILLAAIPNFEFPRIDIFDVDLDEGKFNNKLSLEEMRILREYMIAEWIGMQIASVENIRQKYSSSDFSFTSQASHLDKLIKLKNEYETKAFRLERLYRRRKLVDEGYGSTFAQIMEPVPNANKV